MNFVYAILIAIAIPSVSQPAEVCTKGNCNKPVAKAVVKSAEVAAKATSIVVKRSVCHAKCVRQKVKCCRKRVGCRVRHFVRCR